ncbi:hypothetical protein ACFLZV_07020, partial [Candidatus Margulisiibacteriota bacterium]
MKDLLNKFPKPKPFPFPMRNIPLIQKETEIIQEPGQVDANENSPDFSEYVAENLDGLSEEDVANNIALRQLSQFMTGYSTHNLVENIVDLEHSSDEKYKQYNAESDDSGFDPDLVVTPFLDDETHA